VLKKYFVTLLYIARFDRTGDLRELDAATRMLRRICATLLGWHYLARYTAEGERTDLQCSIEMLRFAAALIPNHDPDRPWILSHLGLAYWKMYEFSGAADDFECAVRWSKRAVAATPPDHPAQYVISLFRTQL
jgi:hypothetical protein